ncbi:ribonuclease H2, subunit B [Radiomyces spectabilis]|uniref:ribonuclease H2, subunit B n=1 Tax=Radiomyces spectabilis TaxID=64574 RepID=UPI00221FF106|nr:ribonuclease H2, subunit B [Radiomyces spectabilis]KAI8391788.1 ribonuclease H2, subunit B [Radiomyces spectabilis]
MSKQFVAFSHHKHNELHSLKPLCLPCPRSGAKCIYLMDTHNRLYEMQKVNGPGRKASWLIKDRLYKDGAFYFITPMDPLFLALSILERAQASTHQAKFRTLDDIFDSESFKTGDSQEDSETSSNEESESQTFDIGMLMHISNFIQQLPHLCEIKEVAPEMHVYCLDENKALAWLRKKVDALVASFDTIPAVSDITKSRLNIESKNIHRQEAVYLLSKYLSRPWFEKLLQSYGLTELQEEQIAGEISNYFEDASPSVYLRSSGGPRDTSAENKKPRKAQIPRNLAKVNTKGMKSLTSFFAKKK